MYRAARSRPDRRSGVRGTAVSHARRCVKVSPSSEFFAPQVSAEYPGVLPKNSIRQLYQSTKHMSNWVTTEKLATKKHRIPRESGCSTITRRPVAPNRPSKLMLTITQRARARVLPGHAANKLTDFGFDGRASGFAAPRFPLPIQSEPFPVPSDDGIISRDNYIDREPWGQAVSVVICPLMFQNRARRSDRKVHRSRPTPCELR